MKDITIKDIFKILMLALKLALVAFAIFQTTNVSVLYQGF